MLNEFKFFDVTLAETYNIAKVRSFVFNKGIEFIFTLCSKEVDAIMKVYATVKDAKVFSYSLDLLDNNDVKISGYAQSTIGRRITSSALSIGALLIKSEIGEYRAL